MRTETEHPDGGSDRSRMTIGVRVRILTTVLLLAALGMGLAGAAFMVFERRQLVDHLDGVLLGDVSTFTARAAHRRPVNHGRRPAAGGAEPARSDRR